MLSAFLELLESHGQLFLWKVMLGFQTKKTARAKDKDPKLQVWLIYKQTLHTHFCLSVPFRPAVLTCV